jgi:hypothetical protein
MGNLKERLMPLVEALEEKGKTVTNLAELEQLILQERPELLRTSYEILAEEREGISPPRMPLQLRQNPQSKRKAAGRVDNFVGKG